MRAYPTVLRNAAACASLETPEDTIRMRDALPEEFSSATEIRRSSPAGIPIARATLRPSALVIRYSQR